MTQSTESASEHRQGFAPPPAYNLSRPSAFELHKQLGTYVPVILTPLLKQQQILFIRSTPILLPKFSCQKCDFVIILAVENVIFLS